jgi:molybdopterin-containing oxidoreductase family iron-sulfur binding subunit
MKSDTSEANASLLRAGFAKTERPSYWRTVEETGLPAGFPPLPLGEFREPVDEQNDAVSRREFLKLLSASLALAGLAGCTRQPIEPIVPYVRQPEDMVPGKPLFFSSAREQDGFATGLLVESHEGHPTKGSCKNNFRHKGGTNTKCVNTVRVAA